MKKITALSVLARNPAIVFRPVDNRLLLYHLHRSDFNAVVDGVAKNVWLALDGRKTLSDIISRLLAKDKNAVAKADQWLPDILRFASDLLHDDLAFNLTPDRVPISSERDRKPASSRSSQHKSRRPLRK